MGVFKKESKYELLGNELFLEERYNIICYCLRAAELTRLGHFIDTAAKVELAVILICVCAEAECGNAVVAVETVHTNEKYCDTVIGYTAHIFFAAYMAVILAVEICLKAFPQTFDIGNDLAVFFAVVAETRYHPLAVYIPQLDDDSLAVNVVLDCIEIFRDESIGIKSYRRISVAAVHLLYVLDASVSGEYEHAGIVRSKCFCENVFGAELVFAEIITNGMSKYPHIVFVDTAVVIGVNGGYAELFVNSGVEHFYTSKDNVPDIGFDIEGDIVYAVIKAAEAVLVILGGIEADTGIAYGNAVKSGYGNNVVFTEKLYGIVDNEEYVLCGENESLALLGTCHDICDLRFGVNAYNLFAVIDGRKRILTEFARKLFLRDGNGGIYDTGEKFILIFGESYILCVFLFFGLRGNEVAYVGSERICFYVLVIGFGHTHKHKSARKQTYSQQQ